MTMLLNLWPWLAGGVGVAAIVGLFFLMQHNIRKAAQTEIRAQEAEASYKDERDRATTDRELRDAPTAESNRVRDRYSRD